MDFGSHIFAFSGLGRFSGMCRENKGEGYDSNTLGCLSHSLPNDIISCQVPPSLLIFYSNTRNDSNTHSIKKTKKFDWLKGVR
ncbi:hypothetical protein Hanom_Chr07g00587291 [Helianthus anomalus]